MRLNYEERFSDSPYVEKIGRFRVEADYSHSCPANILWNMLLVKYKGKTSLSAWGPETKSGMMTYPKDAEFLFIQFKLGSFMPNLPIRKDTGPIVEAVLQDHPQTLSSSAVRHRFLRATGVTQSYIRQLEQAQQAANLLAQGVSILDAVDQAGYADQPHLTRSLKRLIGYTPAQIARASESE